MKIKLTYKILRDFTLFGTILMFIISIITFILYLNGKSELRLLDFAFTINFFGLYSSFSIISKKEEEIKLLTEIDKLKTESLSLSNERIKNFEKMIKCYEKYIEGLKLLINYKNDRIMASSKFKQKQSEIIKDLKKENEDLKETINNSKN